MERALLQRWIVCSAVLLTAWGLSGGALARDGGVSTRRIAERTDLVGATARRLGLDTEKLQKLKQANEERLAQAAATEEAEPPQTEEEPSYAAPGGPGKPLQARTQNGITELSNDLDHESAPDTVEPTPAAVPNSEPSAAARDEESTNLVTATDSLLPGPFDDVALTGERSGRRGGFATWGVWILISLGVIVLGVILTLLLRPTLLARRAPPP